jgi:hypothetical protein
MLRKYSGRRSVGSMEKYIEATEAEISEKELQHGKT